MPLSIPENKIDEIRIATDILDLVSAYVTLKRSGQNYFGLCPFHNEKSPSFSVNPDKQIFHCFGCSAGGNVFTFLMKHEGIGFPESVRMLAKRVNIELDLEERDDQQAKQNEALYHVSNFAAAWYQEQLFSPSGKTALEYLQNRGLSIEKIKIYELGYAPSGWDGLIKQAEKTANDVEVLVQAGLVLQKENGKRYDRFRQRIMFPVKNLSGRVVAFGGRIIKDQPNSPKYLNSPETPIYEKSKVLYGLFQNRDEIRRQDKAIFVEGYMDMLSLLASEIGNVVATSGTALTREQAALIRRYTRHIVLMYDSDSAGSAATLRGADVLIEGDLEVYISSLPENHDPDSFVREFGKAALLNQAEQAQHVFEFKLSGLNAQAPEKRSEGISSLLGSIARVKDRIQRSLLVSNIAEQLHVSEKDLWAELQKVLHQRANRGSRQEDTGQQNQKIAQTGKGSKVEKAVDDLIRILLHDWSVAEAIFNQLDFNNLRAHWLFPILDYFKNQHKGGRQPTAHEIVHHFNDVELASFIVAELNKDWKELDFARWANDCIATIHQENLLTEIAAVREQLKQAQGDAGKRRELLKRCMELENEKKMLPLLG